MNSAEVPARGAGHDPQRVRHLIRALALARDALRHELGNDVEAVIDPESGATILLRSGQDALVRSEAHHGELSTILENVRDSVVVLDRDGLVTFWNRGATALFGYRRSEMLGRSLAAIHPQIPAATIAEDLSAVWRGEERRSVQECRRQDGETRWIDVRSAPVRNGDRIVTGILLVASDVTDHKRLEAELRFATAEAERANRAKSEFLANMSHEIRTPMNGIIGMTDIALDSELTADQRRSLELVRQSADSLLDIINDILDFSKIESGKLALQPLVFDLHDALDRPLNAIAVRAHQKGLELVSSVSAEVPAVLVGDPGRLGQVLVNLVGNAIKFSAAGEVVVSVATEASDGGGALLHFRVRDSGIGIAPDKHAAIFEAFEQADGSSTRRYGGTGLGLAISASLVGLMGGRIWVESELGRGSTFHFTARFGLPPARPSAAAAPSDLQGLRVLVVDDNRTCREALSAYLERLGVRCTAVGSAAAARAALGAGEGAPFQMVLVDSTLPGEDGWSLLRWCADEPCTAWCARGLLGTSLGGDGQQRAAALGARYLTKPASQPALLAALRQAVACASLDAPAADESAALPETRALRVLVAEDQDINQELICRLLAKHGHTVAIAVDGREAVERWERERFDLILMDVQMPVLDGFEATAVIRAAERRRGGHTPIVALTAHAMHGDQRRCLSAGMDAYVSKPLHNRELLALLRRVAAGEPATAPAQESWLPPVDPTAGPIDMPRCLEIVGGQADILSSLAGTFLRGVDARLAALREAIERGDAAQVMHCAHSLKGSLTNFAAEAAVAAARRLEEAGADGELGRARQDFDRLAEEVARVTAVLVRLAEVASAA